MQIPYVDRYRILSIDPGTTSVGMAIVEKDMRKDILNVCFAATFKRSDLIRGHKWMVEGHGERETAVYCYGEIMQGLLDLWEPTTVACESPYMGKFVATFKALTEIITTFKNTTISWDSTVPFELIDPSTVKKYMEVNGGSGDKNDMRAALIGSKDKIYYTNVDIYTLDEHAIDAICVGVWKTKNI